MRIAKEESNHDPLIMAPKLSSRLDNFLSVPPERPSHLKLPLLATFIAGELHARRFELLITGEVKALLAPTHPALKTDGDEFRSGFGHREVHFNPGGLM